MQPCPCSRRWRVVAILLSMLLLAMGAASPAAAAPRHRALLIGINEYRSKAIPDLRGALNDVELIRGVLTTRFGFADEDIEILTDEAATRKGILTALDRFAARTRPDDRVYIHYSGHGSQVRDAGGDEASDGMDETLVPHDGRTPGVPDITDDELAERLAALPTPHVVVVLDSCHSGTATRSLSALRTRRIPTDERDELYPRSAGRQIVALADGGHLLMTGAAHDQEALDGPVDGRTHGFFSYALAQSMSRAGDGASPRQLFRGVETELERLKGQLGLSTFPTPQLEASADRLDGPIWPRAAEAGDEGAAAAPARVAWIRVEPTETVGRVRLIAGPSRGAVRESRWAIHPPGDSQLQPGTALAMGRVVELEGQDAIALLAPAAAIPAGSRAVAAAPPPVPHGVEVHLVSDDPVLDARLREEIGRRLDAVRFVGQTDFARFHVRIGEGQCTVLGADATSEVERFEIADDDQLVTALVAILSRSMNVAELLSLDHPSSEIAIELERVGFGAPTDSRPGDEGGVTLVARTGASTGRIAAPGQSRSAETSMQIRVRSNRACFLTVVDVDAEGGVNLLFPNPLSEARGYLPKGWIEAEQWALVPDSLEPGNQAGFYVDFAEPPGTDTLRAFCAAEERVAKTLRETIASIAGPGADPSAAPRGGRQAETASIFERARQLLTGSLTRGMTIVPAEATSPTPAADPAAGTGSTESAEASSAAGSDETAEASSAAGSDESAASEEAGGATVEPVLASSAPGADWAAATLHIHVRR